MGRPAFSSFGSWSRKDVIGLSQLFSGLPPPFKTFFGVFEHSPEFFRHWTCFQRASHIVMQVVLSFYFSPQCCIDGPLVELRWVCPVAPVGPHQLLFWLFLSPGLCSPFIEFSPFSPSGIDTRIFVSRGTRLIVQKSVRTFSFHSFVAGWKVVFFFFFSFLKGHRVMPVS